MWAKASFDLKYELKYSIKQTDIGLHTLFIYKYVYVYEPILEGSMCTRAISNCNSVPNLWLNKCFWVLIVVVVVVVVLSEYGKREIIEHVKD